MAIDVLKRAKALEAQAILDAIIATDYNSMVGPVKWTGQPVKNVCKTPLVAGQWQRKADKFELVITANKTAPVIPVGGQLQLFCIRRPHHPRARYHENGAMKIPRRRFLLAAGAAALASAPLIARAQTYPARPVRIIVAFAAGGGVDITSRLIGQWLSDRLGQSFITENRPGAGGNIGTEAVVNAPPDGHTLLLATVPHAVNGSLYEKLNFNFIRDIAPVASIIRVPMAILRIHRFRPKRYLSSSPMQKRIAEKSTWRRPGPAVRLILRASCSIR